MQKETKKTFCGVQRSHQCGDAMTKEFEATAWSRTEVAVWFFQPFYSQSSRKTEAIATHFFYKVLYKSPYMLR